MGYWGIDQWRGVASEKLREAGCEANESGARLLRGIGSKVIWFCGYASANAGMPDSSSPTECRSKGYPPYELAHDIVEESSITNYGEETVLFYRFHTL